jgi:hypothetical protein
MNVHAATMPCHYGCKDSKLVAGSGMVVFVTGKNGKIDTNSTTTVSH